MNETTTPAAILSALAVGPLDYGQLINRPALRTTGGLVIRAALAELVAAGLVSSSAGFETYRLV